jgi:hypothetical protein
MDAVQSSQNGNPFFAYHSIAIAFFHPLSLTLCLLANGRSNTMSNPNQQPSQRVLGRMGARILTPEEAAQVNGSQNQTFAFTHIINPDTIRD